MSGQWSSRTQAINHSISIENRRLEMETEVLYSPRWAIAVLLSISISLYGLKKKSLDVSGGLVAIFVGFILTAANGCFCAALLTFFITSSRLTKWRGREKRKIEEDYKEGGQRNWVQVICNGGVASLAALLYILSAGFGEYPLYLFPSSVRDSASVDVLYPTLCALGCLSALACCCGDTWASEVGSVLGSAPRLITTWKRVPKGTNGGVSSIGTLCSLGGGLTVGLAYWITWAVFAYFEDSNVISQLPVVLIAGLAGLVGSFVDSLLGATVQYSGYSEKLGRVVNQPGGDGVKHISGRDIIGNHAVNLVSSLITAIVVPSCWYWTLLRYQ